MTNIEWTDKTWNPVAGCKKVSPGCAHCYAETMAKRLKAMGRPEYADIVDENGWTGKFLELPQRLADPLGWRKPCRVFVNSMSDLFGEGVSFEFIAAVYGVMAACPQHTFQILTKRPERAVEFFEWLRKDRIGGPSRMIGGCKGWENGSGTRYLADCVSIAYEQGSETLRDALTDAVPVFVGQWPAPNVWLGTSIETGKVGWPRYCALANCPAAVRFVSFEPLLEDLGVKLAPKEKCPKCNTPTLESIPSLDGSCWECDRCRACGCQWWNDPPREIGDMKYNALDWVIVGGESGPGARACDIAHIRSIVSQCKAAGVPVFVKQLGAGAWDSKKVVVVEVSPAGGMTALTSNNLTIKDRKGGDPQEWPIDLRVREFPNV